MRSIEQQIVDGTSKGHKCYGFDRGHNIERPADMWFQASDEGEILFVVFYSQACRWSRCVGCNLPSKMSPTHVDFRALMAQVDYVLDHPDVTRRYHTLRKVIVSNNGSVLDEMTFPSAALMYLIARLKRHLPQLRALSLETRVEYVDTEELEFISRALGEGDTAAVLELAIGFEAFDGRIRNRVFKKGLKLRAFERLCRTVAKYDFHLKCYFMLKPTPGMSDEAAVLDVQRAIDYLDEQARRCGASINMHLNPTYVAYGTVLEERFRSGRYVPPKLKDVAAAALHGEGKRVSIFLGLSDEGLACAGGSFIRPGDEPLVAALEAFNRSQDYRQLRSMAGEKRRSPRKVNPASARRRGGPGSRRVSRAK